MDEKKARSIGGWVSLIGVLLLFSPCFIGMLGGVAPPSCDKCIEEAQYMVKHESTYRMGVLSDNYIYMCNLCLKLARDRNQRRVAADPIRDHYYIIKQYE